MPFALQGWEVLIIPAIGFVVWLVSMLFRNASDNAKDLVDDLTLTYNKVRQAGITREVTEIASAAEAMAVSTR